LVIGATGLLPGLISTRSNTSAHLRSGGRSMASGNSRLRRGLVVAQVTLCFLLLLVAGVFIRGVVNSVGGLPPHARHTLITQLRLDVLDKYGSAERRAFVEAFDARMRADSRVRGIGYKSNGVARVLRAGAATDAGQISEAVRIAGDLFDITGVRLLRGRALTNADAAAMDAVVVNEAFVTRLEITEPVVGQPLRLALLSGKDTATRHVTIVGVVSEPGSGTLTDPAAQNPTLYLSLGTSPDVFGAWISADNAAQMADPVRRTLADLDPELPVLGVRTLEDSMRDSSDPLRMTAQAASGLGMVALLLAVSGLYSVIAFFVVLRTNEFGIRVALGARSADIVRMVLGQALRLAAVGLAAGAVLGVPLLIALHANFPFTARFDPAVILPPALALTLTALVAGWVPARRASSIQASDALRAD
jgi:hypothetical protein